jgi:hypothetical protein
MSDGLLMKYFVLKPAGNDLHARASRDAMSHYAGFIWNENPQLAEDLNKWVERERAAAHKEKKPWQ